MLATDDRPLLEAGEGWIRAIESEKIGFCARRYPPSVAAECRPERRGRTQTDRRTGTRRRGWRDGDLKRANQAISYVFR